MKFKGKKSNSFHSFRAFENPLKMSRWSLYLIHSIFRSEMCKINSDDSQNVDYIYSLDYEDNNAVQTNFQPLEVTPTTISCNLEQRQRSSQQILDLADHLQLHQSYYYPIRR